jgi:DNA-binding transcriptional ArsR family regulator
MLALDPEVVSEPESVPAPGHRLRAFAVACRADTDGVFEVLAHAVRRQILQILAGGRCDVATLCRQVGMQQQSVSHHLTIMKFRGTVSYTRTGKTNTYFITKTGHMACSLIELVEESLKDQAQAGGPAAI